MNSKPREIFVVIYIVVLLVYYDISYVSSIFSHTKVLRVYASGIKNRSTSLNIILKHTLHFHRDR